MVWVGVLRKLRDMFGGAGTHVPAVVTGGTGKEVGGRGAGVHHSQLLGSGIVAAYWPVGWVGLQGVQVTWTE